MTYSYQKDMESDENGFTQKEIGHTIITSKWNHQARQCIHSFTYHCLPYVSYRLMRLFIYWTKVELLAWTLVNWNGPIKNDMVMMMMLSLHIHAISNWWPAVWISRLLSQKCDLTNKQWHPNKNRPSCWCCSHHVVLFVWMNDSFSLFHVIVLARWQHEIGNHESSHH